MCAILVLLSGQAALFLLSQEPGPSLADLAAAVQSEYSEVKKEAENYESERRCAALLHYSMTDMSGRSSNAGTRNEDQILESGRVAIDIAQSNWNIAQFSPRSHESTYFAALSLLNKNELSHVASLIQQPTTFKGDHRAEILAKLAQVSLRIGQKNIAAEAVQSLRAFLEQDVVYGVDYDEHTCLTAMIVSASLGDELLCRWYCERLRTNAANVNLLVDFCRLDLNASTLNHSAFSTFAEVVKDLPVGELREQLCTLILFHDRNVSTNNEADHLLWLEPRPGVRCASICRRLFLELPLAQDDELFLTAKPAHLRTVVNWLTQHSIATGNNKFPSESTRILLRVAYTSLPDRSAAMWFIRARLAEIGTGSDPESSRKCMADWIETIESGAEPDVVTSAATQMMRVAISLSDRGALHQILENWRGMRAKMEHVERQIGDAETLRILQAVPDILLVAEVPSDLRSTFPFAVGMIRPRDFQTARASFPTSRERFWFSAGYLSSRLKEEGLITSLVVECCTARDTDTAE